MNAIVLSVKSIVSLDFNTLKVNNVKLLGYMNEYDATNNNGYETVFSQAMPYSDNAADFKAASYFSRGKEYEEGVITKQAKDIKLDRGLSPSSFANQ
jgi:hypothetical protein